jgi:hypothetical protein
MSPISRFVVFTISLSLLVFVAIGSQPRHTSHLSKSINDMCVCVPTRAALIAKAAIAKTRAASAELFASNVTAGK